MSVRSWDLVVWPAVSCHCLCAFVHPDAPGICDEQPVTTIRRYSELTGPRDVPTCAPCAAEVIATERT